MPWARKRVMRGETLRINNELESYSAQVTCSPLLICCLRECRFSSSSSCCCCYCYCCSAFERRFWSRCRSWVRISCPCCRGRSCSCRDTYCCAAYVSGALSRACASAFGCCPRTTQTWTRGSRGLQKLPRHLLRRLPPCEELHHLTRCENAVWCSRFEHWLRLPCPCSQFYQQQSEPGTTLHQQWTRLIACWLLLTK